MPRKALIMVLVVVLAGLAGACSRQQAADPAEAAFEVLKTSWGEAETSDEKTTLAEDYLARFPDTEHSADLAGAVVYYRGNDLEDP